MKKTFTLLFAVGLFTGQAFSQAQNGTSGANPIFTKCNYMVKTPPLRELMEDITFYPAEEGAPKIGDKKWTADWSTINDIGIPENDNMDPVAQLELGNKSGAGMTKANWTGQNTTAFPPDPTGAAGPEHFVQAINSSWRIYEKDGSSVGGQMNLSSLWSGSSNDGDPIIMYDRYADRWFISQFQTSSPFEILIAISETSDPTGAYYAYSFNQNSFKDYPKFGVWSNGYYMSANSNSQNCVIFEREKMILGDASAGQIAMTFPNIPFFFRSYAPIYAEGTTEPGMDDPFYFFHIQDNSWSGVSSDHIKSLKVTVDWTTTSNSNITIDQEIAISSLNTVFTNSWDDIVQPGTTQKLDALAGVFMYRVQYRKFPDYNVALMTTVADVDGNNTAGVRWMELRDDGDGVWYLYQEGTYAPNDGNSRWMASIGMDLNGNIGMAYSFCGPSEYAGIRYTGRYKDDPLGEMTVIEQIAIEGTGFQTGANRYGDYSQMTVDPTDDATFWYTGEWLPGGSSHRTRIFSFAMWELLGDNENKVENPFFNAYQEDPNSLTAVWHSIKDEEVNIQLMSIEGKVILTEKVGGLDKKIKMNLPDFATGIYFIKMTGKNTDLTKKVYLN